MTARAIIDDYSSIFLNELPLIDVRAPVEFHKGAFPQATNIPLLDDNQREAVGIQYKQAGEQEAIALGLEFATAEIRASRIEHWASFSRRHPNACLYCFRGGLRSRTAQQWLSENGIDLPMIEGGYKAMRRYLIDELENNVGHLPMVIVSGLTGTGKTRILREIRRHIDFEGIANHRGSAFGRDASDRQPTSIDWENRVSIEYLKLARHSRFQPVFIEDEGNRIGRVNIPATVFKIMQRAPRAILENDLESRIRLILDDYIVTAWPQYQASYGEQAELEFNRYILDNLARIQKRLGGEKYKQVRKIFETALSVFYARASTLAFEQGIEILLREYYDPMYAYQLASKDVNIVFQGPETEFLDWAGDYLERNQS